MSPSHHCFKNTQSRGAKRRGPAQRKPPEGRFRAGALPRLCAARETLGPGRGALRPPDPPQSIFETMMIRHGKKPTPVTGVDFLICRGWLGLSQCRLGLRDNRAERVGFVHREVGKNLTVNLDAGQ